MAATSGSFHLYRLQQSLSLVLFLSVAFLTTAEAQVCGGDVDGSGFVNRGDLTPFFALLYTNGTGSAQRERADANRDRAVTIADAVRIVQLEELNCAAPTATPTPTATMTPIIPSPTRTPSPTPSVSATRSSTLPPTSTRTITTTPTRTQTRTVTPTPTETCVEQSLAVGATNASLTASDCLRSFGGTGAGTARRTDIYGLTVAPGFAAAIQVVATSTPAITPLIRVIDAAGQFEIVEGQSPIEILSTTSAAYEVLVTSHPLSPVALGDYQIIVTTRACPTPEPLALPGAANRSLDLSDCPDPGAPSVGRSINPSDSYVVQINNVPTNLDILLRRVGSDSAMDPVFSLIGPDGFELFDPAEADDAFPGDPEGSDSQARFLATQVGTYRIIVSSNASLLGIGGELEGAGRYSLSIRSPICAPIPLGEISTVGSTSIAGMLTGNTGTTRCAAPLQIPYVSDDLPELNSAAELYSFTGAAGDLVSIGLEADDDPHLFVYGPQSAGYPLVATDDDSSPLSGDGAQLAVTLPAAGTYLLVVANNFALEPPDPEDPEDRTGEITNYQLTLQRCPTAGGINLETGAMVSTQFTAFDCRGFGNRHHRVYSFQGTAGQFTTIEMRSQAFNSFLRLIGPDGRVVAKEDDPVELSSLDARISLFLPVDGFYFVEASRSTAGLDPLPDDPPAFTLRAYSCPSSTAMLGDVTGAFANGDCATATGKLFDAYNLPAATAVGQVASLLPSNGVCIVGLLPGGDTIPASGCLSQLSDLPITHSPQFTGFLVTPTQGAATATYNTRLALCPMPRIGFGETRTGMVGPGSCAAASGRPSAWNLVSANEVGVRYNEGFRGNINATFASTSEVTDIKGPMPLGSNVLLLEDPGRLLLLGNERAALLRTSGASPADAGSYTLTIRSATQRR